VLTDAHCDARPRTDTLRVMTTCPACGTDNPRRAAFCGTCGVSVSPTVLTGSSEVRKHVTILFADVVESTALGERLEPEVVRGLMARYFAMMKRVIDAYGGTVEKFIGDAVMAVFGVPLLHEDDALRAVRAAAEIRTEMARLNADLQSTRGLEIQLRTGIMTGEIVAGPVDAMPLVTGDPVNTAARLEQAASPGEILIGASTWELVRDVVVVVPAAPIVAKGKALPVPAYRVVEIDSDAAWRPRPSRTPIMGRGTELAALAAAYRRAERQRNVGLVTVVAPAGVGKSRLVAEFIDSLDPHVAVLRGRCPAYRPGSTYWPLRDIVLAAAGIDAADGAEASIAKVGRLLETVANGEAIAARLTAAIGLRSAAMPQEEIFWATCQWLETRSRDRPLVVVFEDIHWAEPTFLDMLEFVSATARDAKLLIICPTRSELLEARPGWASELATASMIVLEPLDSDSVDQLIDSLSGGNLLDGDTRRRIQAAAEGNPLFVEELLGMLLDAGRLRPEDGIWRVGDDLGSVDVPPTIRALLAARLDALPPIERAVAELGAVVGRRFEWAAVDELSSEAIRPYLRAGLDELIRKQLIEVDDATAGIHGGFKFHHALIRDAAYDRLPKSDRADLHEKLGAWIEAVVGDRLPEFDAVIGFHFEQAHGFLNDLGETGDRVGRLAGRAAERLASAGLRAERQYDNRAATSLLGRSRALVPVDDPQQVTLALHVAYASGREGDVVTCRTNLADARSLADRLEAPVLGAVARLVELDFEESFDPERWVERVALETDRLEPLLKEQHEDDGLSLLWQQRLFLSVREGRMIDAEVAARTSARFAHAAGDPWQIERRMLGNLAGIAIEGPMRLTRVLRLCNSVIESLAEDRVRRIQVIGIVALCEAMRGNRGKANQLLAGVSAEVFDRAWPRARLEFDERTGQVHRITGDLPAAERSFRAALDTAYLIDDAGIIPVLAAELGRTLIDIGRTDEAIESSRISEDMSAGRDVIAEILWRCTRALALADLGRGDAAESLAVEAVDIARSTEFLNLTGDALLDLAQVRTVSGRADQAQEAASEALASFRLKGNTVSARRALSFKRNGR
jgi:class 3 adenylate cyclase/tetratricopeptide (TPR) repeat protein